MPSAKQVIALLRTHIEGDNDRFYSIAMQLAAHEAKLGHKKFAQEIRDLVDESRLKYKKNLSISDRPIPISKPRGELTGLLSVTYPKTKLVDMVLEEDTKSKLHRVIKEQRHFTKLQSHGFNARRKLLLLGPPGTGKTMTASALAGELNLTLFVIRMDGLFTKYLGETASKLRLIFDTISENRGVYLFDEFDSIGSQRTANNDVGEVRRILNSFLQFLEQDNSTSIILAATNHPKILDYALFRRFDDVLEYSKPHEEQIKNIISNRLSSYQTIIRNWKRIIEVAEGLSCAEIVKACDETAKEMLLKNKKLITVKDLLIHLKDRNQILKNLKDS